MKPNYPAWATIDLDRIHKNLDLIFAKAGVSMFPVIKANAYGHGAVTIAKEIISRDDVAAVCVMTLAEVAELRRNKIKKRILLLGGILPQQAKEAVDLKCEVVISGYEAAKAISRNSKNSSVPIHVKINTGMARLGADCDDAVALYRKVLKLANIKVVGLMTHFAAADTEKEMTKKQITKFEKVLGAIKAAGYSLPPVSAANTAAIFRHPESVYDAVRPGIGVYGVQPFAGKKRGFLPVLSLYAKVSLVRRLRRGETVSYGMTWKSPGDREVAVVSIGYADGYPRRLSNLTRAIINGSYAPQVGVICMDNCLFDVTGLKAKPGDIVTLIGEEGAKTVTASDLATTCGTIAYEVLCGIGSRPPRLYRKGKRTTRATFYL